MTAGNDRALWWRPPTRAAWRVQQRRSQARVKWLREDAGRMDSAGVVWLGGLWWERASTTEHTALKEAGIAGSKPA